MITLPEEAEKFLLRTGSVDIVLGTPTFNTVETIPHVLSALYQLWVKYLRSEGYSATIIVADGGSVDGTREVAEKYSTPGLEKLVLEYTGVRGKGTAVLTILTLARDLSARAVLIIDSDLREVRPEYLIRYLRPVLDQSFDLVIPRYLRHRFDATITNHVVYPLTALYTGTRILGVIAGDYALSQRLVRRVLRSWVLRSHVPVYRFGIDIFLTYTALSEELRVAEVLGGVKLHRGKDPSGLRDMFREVVSTGLLLLPRLRPRPLLERFLSEEEWWNFLTTVRQVPLTITPNLDLLRTRVQELHYYTPLLTKVLGQDLSTRVREELSTGLTAETWVHCLRYLTDLVLRQEVTVLTYLELLEYLWQARLLKYFSEVWELTDAEAFRLVEEQCNLALHTRTNQQ